MDDEGEGRPALDEGLGGAELRRWYWLVSELQDFARRLGVRTGGGKAVLTDRLAARLDGHPFVEPADRRPVARTRVRPPFTSSTVVPPGQPCSQALRVWFVAEVGPSFRFDEPMRDFFAEADGSTTLGDAVARWHASRGAERKPIGSQFEYNRFTRAWRDEHPMGSAEDLRAAWWAHRALPADGR